MFGNGDPRGNPISRCAAEAEHQCNKGNYQKPKPVFIGCGTEFLKELENEHNLIECKAKQLRCHIRHCVRCDRFSLCKEIRYGKQ